MADSKISALPASTTPLAGTEVLPIVQSSATKQVSVANLTAGRAISATQLTLTTGNLIVASGQGIDFSATSGTGTSELLSDYEEGTWTPSLVPSTSGSISLSTANGRYTKVGNMVTVVAVVVSNGVTAPVGELQLSGLPFTVGGTGGGSFAPFAYGLAATAITSLVGNPSATNTYAVISKYASGGVSNLAGDVQNGTGMLISFSYLV